MELKEEIRGKLGGGRANEGWQEEQQEGTNERRYREELEKEQEE